MLSFILIFNMSLELWFGFVGEICPTMARRPRYWSLCECHQQWSLLRILGRKGKNWDQAKARGKQGAGPEERQAGAVAKMQWAPGSQQRLCLARALAMRQFHGLEQSALLAPICLGSGLVHIVAKWIHKIHPNLLSFLVLWQCQDSSTDAAGSLWVLLSV